MADALKLPVGIESFEEIRKEGFYYIDKTGLIEQLLNQWGTGAIQSTFLLLGLLIVCWSLTSLMKLILRKTPYPFSKLLDY